MPCGPINNPSGGLRLSGRLLDALKGRGGSLVEDAQEPLTGGRDAAGGHLARRADFPRRLFAGDRERRFQGFRPIEQLADVAEEFGDEGFAVRVRVRHVASLLRRDHGEHRIEVGLGRSGEPAH